MGCTSTKQASRNTATLKESGHEEAKYVEDQALAATLLKSPQNKQKTYSAAGAHEPGQAECTETYGNPTAPEVSQQDKVTKVSSNVMLVEFTPEEAADQAEQPSASTPRKSKRKGTPWHGGKLAAINFDDDEIDDDDAKEDETAEPGQLTNEPVERSAMRKATPWHKGGETPESELDDQEREEQCKQTVSVAESGSAFWLFEHCSRPCVPEEEVLLSPR
eukprot:TRINITY_DN407_c0_g1_i1.p1 TRINITY_DN407_c0_g1~~TRINITY_DN407_c0_g1_i1.p1  ORF type:complete len:219 (-),score=51.20 TRINITY_DN407_c0_g1_i1:262-918(-)